MSFQFTKKIQLFYLKQQTKFFFSFLQIFQLSSNFSDFFYFLAFFYHALIHLLHRFSSSGNSFSANSIVCINLCNLCQKRYFKAFTVCILMQFPFGFGFGFGFGFTNENFTLEIVDTRKCSYFYGISTVLEQLSSALARAVCALFIRLVSS